MIPGYMSEVSTVLGLCIWVYPKIHFKGLIIVIIEEQSGSSGWPEKP